VRRCGCLNFGDNGSATGQLLFQIIGAIAEFERALMLERQRAAIADDPAPSGDDDAVGARVEVSKRNSSNVRVHSARINNGTPAHPNQCRRLEGRVGERLLNSVFIPTDMRDQSGRNGGNPSPLRRVPGIRTRRSR
jgi:hypothetical protein